MNHSSKGLIYICPNALHLWKYTLFSLQRRYYRVQRYEFYLNYQIFFKKKLHFCLKKVIFFSNFPFFRQI